jgi:hypothetical protein
VKHIGRKLIEQINPKREMKIELVLTFHSSRAKLYKRILDIKNEKAYFGIK